MKKFLIESAFVLLLAGSAFSQTELFEQDLSGIHPYVGLKWNSNITQPVLGLEYTIESRSTMGIQTGFPLKDTLFSTPGLDKRVESKLHSFFVNPYFMFEFLEPDNAAKFSFSMRGDYIFESTKADSNLNGFSRHHFGLGPVLSMRLHAGEKIDVVPQVAYEFFYIKAKRNWVTHITPPGTTSADSVGEFDDGYFIQHNVSVAANVLYHLDETQGLSFEPKVVLKMGDGLQGSDLLNVDFRVGYFLSF